MVSVGLSARAPIVDLRDLGLGPTGRPREPIRFVDLDRATHPEELTALAAAVNSSLGLCVGVASGVPDLRLRELVEALTVTLVPAGTASSDPRLVPVADAAAEVEVLADAVAAAPQASVVLGQVLRQTERLDVGAGLAAEAAAYSMLLTGAEFGDWLAKRGPGRDALPRSRPPVVLRRDHDRLSILLDRPERRNAMDAALREALVEALAVAVADPATQVELSGAGPNFCSGGDLDEFGTATDVVAAYLVRLERNPGWLLQQVADRTTAYLHGACIGAGIEIPSFAGRIVASPATSFALPEVGMGLIPGAGGTVSIPRRIGRWRTAWLALTGAPVDARTGLSWGLVDEIGSQ
jgi:hypothetical protein